MAKKPFRDADRPKMGKRIKKVDQETKDMPKAQVGKSKAGRPKKVGSKKK